MNSHNLFLQFSNAVVLMAPSRQVLETAVEACEGIILYQEEHVLPDGNSYDDDFPDVGTFGNVAEDVTSLIEFPEEGSLMAIAIHIILLPVKGLVHCAFSLIQCSNIYCTLEQCFDSDDWRREPYFE